MALPGPGKPPQAKQSLLEKILFWIVCFFIFLGLAFAVVHYVPPLREFVGGLVNRYLL